MRRLLVSIATVLATFAFTGCEGPSEDQQRQAISDVTADYLVAVGQGEGGAACRLLTPEAQAEAVLQVKTGMQVLYHGNDSCSSAVGEMGRFLASNGHDLPSEAELREAVASGEVSLIDDGEAKLTYTALDGRAQEVYLDGNGLEWKLITSQISTQ